MSQIETLAPDAEHLRVFSVVNSSYKELALAWAQQAERVSGIAPNFICADDVSRDFLTSHGFSCLLNAATREFSGTSCLIPRFDGVILSREWKEALWDKFVTGAPRPRTPSELQYSDRKLRSRN